MSLVADGIGGVTSGRRPADSSGGFGAAVKRATSHVSADAAERRAVAAQSSNRGHVSADAAERRAASQTSRTAHVSADTAERRASHGSDGSSCAFIPAAPQQVTVEAGDTIWEYWQGSGHFAEWQPYKATFNVMNADILADGWLHPGEVADLPADPADGTWDCAPVEEPEAEATPEPDAAGGPDSPAYEPHPQPTATPELPSGLPPYMYPGWTPPEVVPELPSGLPPYMYPGWTPTQAPGWHPPMASGADPSASASPFSVGPMSLSEDAADLGIRGLNTWANVSTFLPGILGGDDFAKAVGGMFHSDRGQQVSIKVLTPSVTLTNPTFGSYADGQATLKVHGWAAEKTEVSLSPSWVNASGERMRSGTISVTIGGQYEVIGEINAPQGDARGFRTVNEAKVISYTITTNEDRLEDLMTGQAPLPNLQTLENFEVGDTVTISTGPTDTIEHELRVMAGKSAGRAGADFKLDDWTAESQKFTVKMVAGKDAAQTPHVLVLDGERQAEGSSVGFGLIWNPKLGTTPDGNKGTGPLDSYADGAFGRVLLQAKESEEHETYNFIELDPSDTSAGGGRALYDTIVDTGVVAYDEDSNSVPGALAVGTMTTDLNTATATLQLTGYWQAKGGNSVTDMIANQVIGQYSLDLLTMIDQESRTNVVQGDPSASVGMTGDTKVAVRYSDGGFTNYFHDYTVNVANYVSAETFILTAEGVKKDQMISALRDGAIGSVTLYTADGEELTGQDAVTWMRTHEDGWVGSNDEVNVVVDMGTRANADSFSETFIADQKTFHDDQQDGFWENLFYEMGQNYWQSPEIAFATLAAPDVFSNPDARPNLDEHQNAETADENFKAMSGSGMGNLLSSMNHYWKHAGHSEGYPISVKIFVEWQP